jgi:transcriptional regulator with XRE-family HTH domain
MNHPNRARIKDWPSYIRRFRERHGLTQPDLANLLTAGQENDVFVSTIQRWEYGDRKPPPYLKLALAQIAAKLTRESEASNAIPEREK